MAPLTVHFNLIECPMHPDKDQDGNVFKVELYYKYHPALYRWCGHAGAWTQWAGINGDGRMIWSVTISARLIISSRAK